jgi:5,10-methylenetetrahydromethanopterin reductase
LCAVAGEIADEVKVGGSANPDIVPFIQSYIAEGERKTERQIGSVGVVMGAVTVVDEDRDQARALARRSVALYLPVVAPLDPSLQIEPEFIERLRQHINRNDYDAAAKLISDDVLDRFAFAGNANDLIQQAERLFAAGACRIEFGTPHGLLPQNGIQIIGEKIIPALKS